MAHELEGYAFRIRTANGGPEDGVFASKIKKLGPFGEKMR